MRPVLFCLLLLVLGCSAPPTVTAPSESDGNAGAPPVELARGANIAGANGIHFGPNGLLYVASVIGSDLTVLDPTTGDIVRRLTASDGVIGPDDVAFASDGSFYWTSILTGEVAGFDADGERVVAAQLSPGPNPITFSDDDRLFVSQCFLGTNLYELDPQGVAEPRLIADDLGPGCGLNGMDWGPDGRLYGPRWFVGEVVSFDVDSGERRVEAEGFVTPAAIKFDSQGVLHVLDTGAGTVVRVTSAGNEVIATLTPGLDNFAFDANDRLFVSSFTDGFVKRVNDDGTQTTLQPGGMAHPGGVAVIGDRVWVADIHAIRGFDPVSGEEVETQRNVVGVGAMGGAINLSADGEQLVLTSWFDGDVRVWDPVSKQRIAHYPDLAAPVAAVRYAGGVAVAEHSIGSVRWHGPSEPVVLATDLPAPTGLAVVGDDLYVSDRVLGSVLKIASAGVALAAPVVMATELDAPEGFVVTGDSVVVVEADAARVVEVRGDGTRRVLAEFPGGSVAAEGTPPSQVFNGIAADELGNYYVSDESSRALYRMQSSEP
ncbi:MAG: hypothetical protein AAF648_13195 [Pseudomonadota bacterium]